MRVVLLQQPQNDGKGQSAVAEEEDATPTTEMEISDQHSVRLLSLPDKVKRTAADSCSFRAAL